MCSKSCDLCSDIWNGKVHLGSFIEKVIKCEAGEKKKKIKAKLVQTNIVLESILDKTVPLRCRDVFR